MWLLNAQKKVGWHIENFKIQYKFSMKSRKLKDVKKSYVQNS